MKSPFKFLDPFKLADRAYFFGRDKETKQLYRLVQQTPLLILYGLSGTGKTSLIQCGLAGEFDGPDWLPLWIRHQANINDSLQAAIKRLLPESEGEIPSQIWQLYKHFLRPVYLIFDQFEELFILGEDGDQKKFIATLKTILDDELPCTILIVIREEYLGRLYPFEKAISSLFDYRLRVEPMDNANVKTVLRESFQKFNIEVEGENQEQKEERLEEIIKNVSLERSGVELPYLQVYLDQLYHTYPEQRPEKGESWPHINITKKAISKFGKIDEVLTKYLDKQIVRIARLLDLPLDAATNSVKLALNGFVSDEKTKRPVRYKRIDKIIELEPAQRIHFTPLSPQVLSLCFDEFEKAKLIRSEPGSVEIAHDSLAEIIYGWRTDEQRERDNFKNQIRLASSSFSKTGEYLTRKQLVKFEDVLPILDKEEALFFRNSKQAREEEEEKTLKKEIDRSNELGKALVDKNSAKIEAERQVLIAQENTKKLEREVKLLREEVIEARDANAISKDKLVRALREEVIEARDANVFLKKQVELLSKTSEENELQKSSKTAQKSILVAAVIFLLLLILLKIVN